MFWRRVGWCGLRRLHIHAAHSTHRDLEVALHQCIEEIQATSTNASQSACWFVYAGKGYSGNTLYQLPNMFGKICSNASMLGGVVDAVGGHTQAITVVRFMPNASSVQPFYIPAAHLPPRRAKSVGRWPSSIGSFTAPVGAGPGAIVDTPWHLNDFQSVTRAPIVDCLPSVLKVNFMKCIVKNVLSFYRINHHQIWYGLQVILNLMLLLKQCKHLSQILV
jgi:hypothetical protein